MILDLLIWEDWEVSTFVADVLIMEWDRVSPMYEYFFPEQARVFIQGEQSHKHTKLLDKWKDKNILFQIKC